MTLQTAIRELEHLRSAQGKALSDADKREFAEYVDGFFEDERLWQYQVAPGEVPWE